MSDRGLENSETPPKSVRSILRTVRRPTHKKYLQIFKICAKPGGATVNQISSDICEKPQTVHPLVGRMIDREGLIRERRGAEYHYCLAPGISLQEIESLLRTIADKGSIGEQLDMNVGGIKNLQAEQPKARKPTFAEIAENLAGDIIDDFLESARQKDMVNLNKDDHGEIEQSMEPQEMLQLPKLPALPEFNPSWSEEQQSRWFTLYEKIIALRESKRNG